MGKVCKYCGIEQNVDQFYKSKRHLDGYEHKCKTCFRNYSKKRYKDDPERQKRISAAYFQRNPNAKREALIKYTYGISLEQYGTILESQDNKCGICQRSRAEFKRELDVDHNHATGKIRGLLCPSCNKALGLFNDSIELLLRAINYLKTNDV